MDFDDFRDSDSEPRTWVQLLTAVLVAIVLCIAVAVATSGAAGNSDGLPCTGGVTQGCVPR